MRVHDALLTWESEHEETMQERQANDFVGH